MTPTADSEARYLKCRICGVAMHEDLRDSHIANHLDSFAPNWPRVEDDDLYPDDDDL